MGDPQLTRAVVDLRTCGSIKHQLARRNHQAIGIGTDGVDSGRGNREGARTGFQQSSEEPGRDVAGDSKIRWCVEAAVHAIDHDSAVHAGRHAGVGERSSCEHQVGGRGGGSSQRAWHAAVCQHIDRRDAGFQPGDARVVVGNASEGERRSAAFGQGGGSGDFAGANKRIGER